MSDNPRSFVASAKHPVGVFYPRLAHLDIVDQQASVRLERLRTKHAIAAIVQMKRIMANFADHIGLMKEKKVAPVSFAYAFGTFMAGIKAFRETVGITNHSIKNGGATEELKSAAAALKRFADEFKAESQKMMDDATDFMEDLGIAPAALPGLRQHSAE